MDNTFYLWMPSARSHLLRFLRCHPLLLDLCIPPLSTFLLLFSPSLLPFLVPLLPSLSPFTPASPSCLCPSFPLRFLERLLLRPFSSESCRAASHGFRTSASAQKKPEALKLFFMLSHATPPHVHYPYTKKQSGINGCVSQRT